MAVRLIQGKQIATASWAINALTASYLDGYTSPFPFTGSAQITGSLGITGSLNVTQGITGSLFGTSSWATNSISSSFPLTVTGSTLRSTYRVGGIGASTVGSIFIGSNAGLNATDASTSNFLGNSAGNGATNAISSNFLGQNAGQNAIYGSNSNFFGQSAGQNATNANSSNFFGRNAGFIATGASNSNFMGYSAGQSATSASYSTLLGYQAGYNISVNLNDSIGSNNIIIGTNITLEAQRKNSINLGGIIFATGSYSTTIGNPFSGSVTGAKVGIGTSTPQYTLDISGSLNVTQGITGSLFGTSSFASTASFAPNYLPLTGGTINGNVVLNGTASISFLNVTYQSSSIIYSSGSNQFGDATNDTQTLIGTVIVSGSQRITGSLNVTQGITGSLFGTASFAISSSRAVTSSFAISASWAPLNAGGSNTQIQFNSGSTLRGTGSFTFNYQSQSLQQGNAVTASGIYSHAQGQNTVASGQYSHTRGFNTAASGPYSHAEGETTQAIGGASHAEGGYTQAIGNYSHAEGASTQAIGNYSHAEGSSTQTGTQTAFQSTVASGLITIDSAYSDVTGNFTAGGYLLLYDAPFDNYYGRAILIIDTVTWDGTNTFVQLINTGITTTTAYVGDLTFLQGNLTFGGDKTIPGNYSHTEGEGTVSLGTYSHAEGYLTQATGPNSHTEGRLTQATGIYSHAEGAGAQAIGEASHAEGAGTIASGDYSHAEGNITKAIGNYSHAEGLETIASGSYSHAEGYATTALGQYSHAEGDNTQAIGEFSHAEGKNTTARGDYSHAEGRGTTAVIDGAHAEGFETIASGSYSHAEGSTTISSGSYSHAEGFATISSGNSSHAEGRSTIASGISSHAEGLRAIASGSYSHAEGIDTIASGQGSHAEGSNTIASGSFQHVQGQYNISSSAQSAFIIGNGTADNARSNLVFASGSTFQITGSVTATQGITGSLFGTASYATQAVSSSFAATASFAPNYLPLTGGTINGNVTVNGTASIAFLNVTYESASVIYSSGSNVFGDATNDIQTLIGTVIVSGSQQITGSLNVTAGITGSLFGTSSNIQGGTASYIPLWNTATSLSSSTIYQDGTGDLGIGTTSPLGILHLYKPAATTRMVMDGDAGQSKIITFRTNRLQRFGLYCNSTAESGANAGSDFVFRAYNDAGTLLSTPLFIKRSSGNIGIGTTAPGAKLDVHGSAIITGSLVVTGSLIVTAGITGSLFGTSSWATNAVTASFITGSNVFGPFGANSIVSASFAVSSSRAISSSFATSASFATQALSASFAPGTPAFPFTGSALITGSLGVTGSLDLTYNTAAPNGITVKGHYPKLILNNTGVSATAAGGVIATVDDNFATKAVNAEVFTIYALNAASLTVGGIVYTKASNSATNTAFNYNSSATTAIYISGSGNVGIKTTTPTSASLTVNGNVWATSFTGSLFGTASFAQTASFAPAYLPLTGGTINGNVTVNGTASIAFLNVTIESASVIYSSGSNQFGDATNDIQTLIGTVIVSGSQQITGSSNLRGTVNITPATSTTSSLVVTGPTLLSGSQNTISGSVLTVVGSGSAQPVFTVQGSQGELFSVTDSLSGSLFSVNDISGLPIVEVFSDGTTLMGDYLDPMLITTKKVTLTGAGAFTIYSLPTASYDTAFFDYSVRSGSNARAGQIMAIQSASVVNYTETTTMDFGSTSGLSLGVFISGSNMVLTGSAATSAWTIKTIIRSL